MKRVSVGSISPHERFEASPPAYRALERPQPITADITGLLRFLRRRAKWIIGSTIIALLLGLSFYMLAPARYRSVAELLIDPRGVVLAAGDTSSQTQGADSNLIDLETQRYLILSRTVLGAVVDSENLGNDPRFLSSGFFGQLFKFNRREEDQREAALAKLADAVEVVRGERAFILDIAVTTTDPELSARIANALCRSFFAQQNSARNEAARRAALGLQNRAEQLARQVQEAEAKVERYKAEHDLSGLEGKLTSEQQLGDISYQLDLARAQTVAQRARYEETLKLQRSGAKVDTLNEAVRSPTIAGLRARYAALVEQKSALEMQYGPRYPALVDIRNQLHDVEGLIKAELSRIAGSALSDYERARAAEIGLENTLELLKQKSFRLNEAKVGLRALERSVEATRSLYQSSLARAKQLEETQEVDNSTSRIITEAVPNHKRGGPPLALVIGGAIVCGLGLGSALGYVKDLAEGNVSSREDFERLLGLPLLAQVRLAPPDTGWSRRLFVSKRARPTERRIARSTKDLLKWMVRLHKNDYPRIVLFIGLDKDERKHELLFELGVAAIMERNRVVIIDSDATAAESGRRWRRQAHHFAIHKKAQDIELIRYDTPDTVFAISGGGLGFIEFLSLADMIRLKPGKFADENILISLKPWIDTCEYPDIILINAEIERDTWPICAKISEAAIVLVDGDSLSSNSLADLSNTIASDIPEHAAAALVGERKLF
jgi:polysaccharide biosynthesis transport protein